jgi:pimeloyl-ACP methyl ester carboxylesterase
MAVNGVSLAYEDHGEGFPLVWAHEYAGSMETWRPQVRFFARRYRVITYNARGYPPSDVPTDPEVYSIDQSVDDLYALLKGLGISQAHIGGLSMGGGVTTVFGLRHPEMTRSMIIASAGSGSTDPVSFRQAQQAQAERLERGGIETLKTWEWGATRVQLKEKDPVGWQEFIDQFEAHSPAGMALTCRGVQGKRPPLYEYEADLKRSQVPALVLIGDEDEPCIDVAWFLKRMLPNCGLMVFPRSGHAINLEEPDLFNRCVLDFLTAVDGQSR